MDDGAAAGGSHIYDTARAAVDDAVGNWRRKWLRRLAKPSILRAVQIRTFPSESSSMARRNPIGTVVGAGVIGVPAAQRLWTLSTERRSHWYVRQIRAAFPDWMHAACGRRRE